MGDAMSSVNDRLSTAATALNARSKAPSSVSSDIANSSTTGDKSASTDFASLLCGTDPSTDEAEGGVTATSSATVPSRPTPTAISSTTRDIT